MEERRDITEILYDIKSELQSFNKEEFIDYAKLIVVNLHNEFKETHNIKAKCSSELIEKMKKNLNLYRATEDIDLMNIQYAELYDCIRKDDELYVQVYLSVCFYDCATNNDPKGVKDKWWNDIWIVTLRKDRVLNNEDKSNCDNCGGKTTFNAMKNIYKCDYCGTATYNYRSIIEWELVDISVKN